MATKTLTKAESLVVNLLQEDGSTLRWHKHKKLVYHKYFIITKDQFFIEVNRKSGRRLIQMGVVKRTQEGSSTADYKLARAPLISELPLFQNISVGLTC